MVDVRGPHLFVLHSVQLLLEQLDHAAQLRRREEGLAREPPRLEHLEEDGEQRVDRLELLLLVQRLLGLGLGLGFALRVRG